MGTLTVKCKLNNGGIQVYHAASKPNTSPYSTRFFYYIGNGVIHSIGGKKQFATEELSFFRLKKGDKILL